MASFDSIVCPDGVVLAFRRSPTDATDPQLTREEIAMGMLVDQNAALRVENERLRRALGELVDWQNGPPLLGKKWVGGWGHAMELARDALAPGVRP